MTTLPWPKYNLHQQTGGIVSTRVQNFGPSQGFTAIQGADRTRRGGGRQAAVSGDPATQSATLTSTR